MKRIFLLILMYLHSLIYVCAQDSCYRWVSVMNRRAHAHFYPPCYLSNKCFTGPLDSGPNGQYSYRDSVVKQTIVQFVSEKGRVYVTGYRVVYGDMIHFLELRKVPVGFTDTAKVNRTVQDPLCYKFLELNLKFPYESHVDTLYNGELTGVAYISLDEPMTYNQYLADTRQYVDKSIQRTDRRCSVIGFNYSLNSKQPTPFHFKPVPSKTEFPDDKNYLAIYDDLLACCKSFEAWFFRMLNDRLEQQCGKQSQQVINK